MKKYKQILEMIKSIKKENRINDYGKQISYKEFCKQSYDHAVKMKNHLYDHKPIDKTKLKIWYQAINILDKIIYSSIIIK